MENNKNIDILDKKIKKYKTLIRISILIWFIIQSAWIFYWIHYEVSGIIDMHLHEAVFYFLTLFFSILYAAYTHRQYRILKSFKKLMDDLIDKNNHIESK